MFLQLFNGYSEISFKTYKNFLKELDAEDYIDAAGEKVTIVLNDKGDVKTYAVKDEIKKLGFLWDKDKKGWKKAVNSDELEKIKNLKVGYDIIKEV